MKIRTLLIVISLLATVPLAGCYVDPAESGVLVFHGNVSADGDQFSMNGTLTHSMGNPAEDSWQDIEIILADEDCRELHREPVGTLQNASTEIPVSVSFDDVPHHVIISSPTVWEGDTGAYYYERLDTGDYSVRAIDEIVDLPEGCRPLVS